MSMRQERAALEQLTRMWWLFLITGILWFLVSLVVLRFSTESITTVGILIGAVFVMAAVNEFFVFGVEASGWKWLHLALGVLFLLGGIWGFANPKEAFWALASIVGLLLVLKGTVDIVESVVTKHVNPLWGLGLAVGIFEVALGFWASQQYYPARAALIIIWVGFAAMFRGIGEIVTAFRLRSLGKGGGPQLAV